MTNFRSAQWPASNRRSPAAVIATVLAVMALPPAGQAQDAEETLEIQEPKATEGPQFRFAAQGGLVYQGEADIEGPGDASMQVNRFDAAIGFRTPLSDRLNWLHSFHIGINDYDFEGGGFSAGDPWETVLESRYGTQLAYSIDDKWGVRGGGVVMLSRETDADWEDGLTGGGTFGVDYRHSDSLFFSVGLGIVSQIEDDVTAVPMVAIQWVPAELWVVRVGAVPANGGATAGAEVAYQFDDQWQAGLGLLYRKDRFRLDDSGPAPDGVGEEQFLPLRLRLAWSFHPQITLNFLAGMALGGELKLEDTNGNNLRKEDYDPAAYLGVRVFGRF